LGEKILLQGGQGPRGFSPPPPVTAALLKREKGVGKEIVLGKVCSIRAKIIRKASFSSPTKRPGEKKRQSPMDRTVPQGTLLMGENQIPQKKTGLGKKKGGSGLVRPTVEKGKYSSNLFQKTRGLTPQKEKKSAKLEGRGEKEEVLHLQNVGERGSRLNLASLGAEKRDLPESKKPGGMKHLGRGGQGGVNTAIMGGNTAPYDF